MAGSEPALIGDDDLIRRFDQHRAEVDEAYGAYEELRAKCPVAHSDAHGGYYMLVRHADVRKAALDWKTFSSAKGVNLPHDSTRPPLPAIEYDPPEHSAWRKLYTDALLPAALRTLEPQIEQIADGLIDQFAASDSCDLVQQFCEPLPVLGISAAIGLTGKKPHEIRELALLLTKTATDPEAQQQAVGRLAQFIMQEIHARRETPRDDYLTTIALAEINGRRLDDNMTALAMIGFLVAGHETTSSALAGLLFHVLRSPELRRRVMEDDNALSAAIEEAVRVTAPFHGFSRTTTKPVQIGDTHIAENQVVRLCWAAANRDPAVFPNADEFDIDRPTNPHLGFGAGRHVCAGAPFARLEMRVAIRQLLKRLPDISLTQSQLDWNFLGGMITIPEGLSARPSPSIDKA